jgi:hypothetical protein
MSPTQFRPLGFGEVLDAAFSLYRRNFFPFFLSALIPAIPMSMASTVLVFQTMGEPGPMAGLLFLPVMAVMLVAVIVQWGALAQGFSQAYTGGPVSLGGGFRAGFRGLLSLLAISVIAYVAMLALAMVVMIPLVMIMVASGVGEPGGMNTTEMAMLGAGMLAVVALLLLLMAVLFAVTPAVVLERCGPIQAITRSVALSRGARLRILGIVLVGWIVAALPMIGVGALMGTLGQMATGQPPASAQILYAQQLVSLLGGALTTPFWVGSLVMAYFDRRIRTEALDLHVAADALAPA